MSLLEIISKLCEVTEILSEIVKKQQSIIEQSKVEEAIKEELQQNIKEVDKEANALEYRMRKYCDVDDVEATEKILCLSIRKQVNSNENSSE